jgi:hypothetical protein
MPAGAYSAQKAAGTTGGFFLCGGPGWLPNDAWSNVSASSARVDLSTAAHLQVAASAGEAHADLGAAAMPGAERDDKPRTCRRPGR